MRRLILAALISVSLPAMGAEQCDHWTAAMQEDEGGSVMTAAICAQAGKNKAYLSLTCGDAGKLSVRFLPVPTDGFPPSSDYKTKLEFALDQDKFSSPAVYEDMDGALAAGVEIGAPFIDMLQTQKQMTVSETGGKAPGATFPLKGSHAAMRKLIATCARN